MAMSVEFIIGLAIGVYVLAALLPGALTAFFAVNTTTWDTSTIALWGIVPLIIVVVVVVVLYRGK